MEVTTIPTSDLVPDRLGICILSVSDWVVDNREIATITRNGSAYTRAEIAASIGGVPLLWIVLDVIEAKLMFMAADDPLNVATELLG
ncbi:hypothetical protein D3C80_1185580 [compost metagenome]